jgi:DNA-binding transcriptional MerR regulator
LATKKRIWQTPNEAAREADVTSRTIRRWCELGLLPARQTMTGRWRIYRSKRDLESNGEVTA